MVSGDCATSKCSHLQGTCHALLPCRQADAKCPATSYTVQKGCPCPLGLSKGGCEESAMVLIRADLTMVGLVSD